MAWGSQEKPPKEDDGGRSRFAAPPTCPRCELTKSQMNRTIQNYQKAYRKKVEGLKQELTTVRADNQHLRAQVRRLRKKRLVAAPSLALGAALGFLVTKAVQHLRQQQQKKEQEQQPERRADGPPPPPPPAAAAAAANGVAAH